MYLQSSAAPGGRNTECRHIANASTLGAIQGDTIKLNPQIDSFLNLPTTVAFLEAVRNFIALLEDRTISPVNFYKASHQKICELYLAGLNFELRYPDSTLELNDHELFENRNANVISFLGDEAIYTDNFDPVYDQESEPFQKWLDSDYLEIYQELKTNLAKLDKIGTNEAIEDALWEFKFGFIHSWGNHCIDAMRALHYLKYDGKPIA